MGVDFITYSSESLIVILPNFVLSTSSVPAPHLFPIKKTAPIGKGSCTNFYPNLSQKSLPFSGLPIKDDFSVRLTSALFHVFFKHFIRVH